MSAFNLTTRKYSFSNGVYQLVSTASSRSGPIQSEEVLLHASARMHIRVGGSEVVASNGSQSLPLEAGEKFHLQITKGQYIAAIQDSETGVLTILPTAL